MTTHEGLRERKKRETRESLTDVALVLFADRGFDHVTVAEVAQAANVSEATVFNYFGTKEALVYRGMEDFEQSLLEAIRGRPAGQSLVDAFGDFVVKPGGLLSQDDREAGDRIATVSRIVAESPTLQARDRQIFDELTRHLAELIAAEIDAAPEDITPWVVANALTGLHRALKASVHRSVQAGLRGSTLRDAVLEQGAAARAILEQGLASYDRPVGGANVS